MSSKVVAILTLLIQCGIVEIVGWFYSDMLAGQPVNSTAESIMID